MIKDPGNIKSITKRITYILLVLLLPSDLVAQFNYFSKYYNPFETWSGGNAILEKSNGYIGVAVSTNPSTGYKEILFLNLNYKGILMDWKSYGAAPEHYYSGKPGSLIKTNDGGYATVGAKVGTERTVGLFLKLDNNLDTLWSVTYKDTVSTISSYISLAQCKQTIDGGYVFTGEMYLDNENSNILLLKTDSLGNKEWEKNYDGCWTGWVEYG